MHDHIAGERNGEVVAQTFLTELRGQMQGVALIELLVCGFLKEVTRVQNLEEQLVALFAVLAH